MTLHNIPSILLLCMEPKYITAFDDAVSTHWPELHSKVNITTINSSLRALSQQATPENKNFDLVVSPANSYGLLDGAFDDAISRTFCLSKGIAYETLTYAVQEVLYEKYRGFAPPGSCTLVRFPPEMLGEGEGDEGRGKMNEWGCRWVGICPTMRFPDNVVWDREVVYEVVWNLLCQVEGWNRGQEAKEEAVEGQGQDRIDTILMTPMATGVGRVTQERWAAQFVMALKHFVDALERPDRWGRLTWFDLHDEVSEVEETHKH